MKKWMKKITVLLITILTLGLYVPPIYLEADLDEVDKGTPSDESSSKSVEQQQAEEKIRSTIDEPVPTVLTNQLYLQSLNDQAKDQVIEKLGQKISANIDTDLEVGILPNMELVLDHLYDELGEDQSQYLMIADHSASGYGERIFNLRDLRAKQDVARFHVNRLKRPQDGYYFQFHYHLNKDNFEEHYSIGEVFWGKDTPPKWMT